MRLATAPFTLVRLPAELVLAVARAVTEGAVATVKLAQGMVAGGEEAAPQPVPAEPPGARRAPPPSPPRRAENGWSVEPPVPEPAAPEPPGAEPPAPLHVSEEPRLVAESAEAGAEDGAGADVSIEEPWPGYVGMRAAEIRDRLVAGGPEVAAAVSLYEAAHKGRRSVLEAAGRSMRG